MRDQSEAVRIAATVPESSVEVRIRKIEIA